MSPLAWKECGLGAVEPGPAWRQELFGWWGTLQVKTPKCPREPWPLTERLGARRPAGLASAVSFDFSLFLLYASKWLVLSPLEALRVREAFLL